MSAIKFIYAMKNINKVPKRKISKKGLDEKVATVLLVGLIIMLILIGFLWAREFIKNRASKETKLAEKQFQCRDVALTVRDVSQEGSILYVNVENKKDTKIDKIIFRVGVETESKPIESFDALNGMEIKRYELNVEGIGSIETVDVIPWIKAAKSTFVPCSEQHVIARISS